MTDNDIIAAYETEFGVTIHRSIASEEYGCSAISIQTYEPEDEDFQWALTVAKEFSND